MIYYPKNNYKKMTIWMWETQFSRHENIMKPDHSGSKRKTAISRCKSKNCKISEINERHIRSGQLYFIWHNKQEPKATLEKAVWDNTLNKDSMARNERGSWNASQSLGPTKILKGSICEPRTLSMQKHVKLKLQT